MAGKRNNIAWWRRVRHLAIMLCVQSIVLWVVLCCVAVDVTFASGDSLRLNAAAAEWWRVRETFMPPLGTVGEKPRIDVRLGWRVPTPLPFGEVFRNYDGAGAMHGWRVVMPLWPLPPLLAALAWHARRRITRLHASSEPSREPAAPAIAKWRRARHAFTLLALQGVLVLAASCGVIVTFARLPDTYMLFSQASVAFGTLPPGMRKWMPLDEPYVHAFVASGPPRWLPTSTPRYGITAELKRFVPMWPVPVAFAGLAWYAGLRIKRLRRDVCAKCGYDMRGLAAGAVCPECGAACGV